MPAGRPKGTYKRTPAIDADFRWDAQFAAEKLEDEELRKLFPEKYPNVTWEQRQQALSKAHSSKSAVAKELKKLEKYKHLTEEHLQNLLSKDHLRKKSDAAIDEFNEQTLSHMLNEQKTEES